ncbi:super-infection exclusion protein B [Pseudovibrio sp. Alg231-02]|uniref:super-infection exclusion protein B n=1 Tax=Pseudovibrio sp. Alg231-02 TaxID=1922223 RepID=UPI000D551ADA|nr:super-infection exclusion protein B [Pseudovibrio sp. Alg231-02]
MSYEWITNHLNKIFNKEVAFAAFLGSVFILVIPETWAITMGINELRVENALLISLLAIISGAVLFAKMMAPVLDLLGKHIENALQNTYGRQDLKKLTPAEKEMLRPFIEDESAYITGPINNGTLNLLQGKKIIARASNFGCPGYSMNFHWILQPWARKILERNPDRYLTIAKDQSN